MKKYGNVVLILNLTYGYWVKIGSNTVKYEKIGEAVMFSDNATKQKEVE